MAFGARRGHVRTGLDILRVLKSMEHVHPEEQDDAGVHMSMSAMLLLLLLQGCDYNRYLTMLGHDGSGESWEGDNSMSREQNKSEEVMCLGTKQSIINSALCNYHHYHSLQQRLAILPPTTAICLGLE